MFDLDCTYEKYPPKTRDPSRQDEFLHRLTAEIMHTKPDRRELLLTAGGRSLQKRYGDMSMEPETTIHKWI